MGDIDELWADVQKANDKLEWKPELTLKDMCAHSWKWQSKYPMGFRHSSQSSHDHLSEANGTGITIKNGISAKNGNHGTNGVNGVERNGGLNGGLNGNKYNN